MVDSGEQFVELTIRNIAGCKNKPSLWYMCVCVCEYMHMMRVCTIVATDRTIDYATIRIKDMQRATEAFSLPSLCLVSCNGVKIVWHKVCPHQTSRQPEIHPKSPPKIGKSKAVYIASPMKPAKRSPDDRKSSQSGGLVGKAIRKPW